MIHLELLVVPGVATLCAAIACAPVEVPKAQPTTATKSKAAPAAADAESPAPAPPPDRLREPKGEPAYFVLADSFVQLDGAGFDTLAIDEPLYSLQLGKNGKLHAIAFDAVLALVDGALVPITARATEGLQAVHVVADDDIWATRMAELVHWDGRAWRHEPLTAIDALQNDFEVERSPIGVVVDRDAHVWLSTARDVMVKDEHGWHTLERARLGGAPKQLWLDHDRSAELQLASQRFVRLPKDPRAAPTSGRAPRGSVWLERNGATWSLVHVDMHDRSRARTLGRDIAGPMAFGYAADARDRVWVSTAAGVTIFDGKASTSWPMGTIEALDGRVDHLLVIGRGPETVPAAGPLRTGGLRARLMKDGKPVAGARVEICTHALAVTIPPCAESHPSFAATSDRDGRFTIDDVPAGIWNINVKIGDEWRLLNRGLEPFRVGAGEPTDFGELDATRGMVAR